MIPKPQWAWTDAEWDEYRRLNYPNEAEAHAAAAGKSKADAYVQGCVDLFKCGRDAGRREALEECAKHVESLLEHGERLWDAAQLAAEIRGMSGGGSAVPHA